MSDTPSLTPQVPIKTTVSCELGISISDPSGSWQKPVWTISIDLTGYPTPQTLTYYADQMMSDNTQMANKFIQLVADKIIEKVQQGQQP